MYIEKKTIGGEVYNYLKVSARYKDKVRTKSIAYLGKGKLSKEHLQKERVKYRLKAEMAKKQAMEELMLEADEKAEKFLEPEQLKKIEEIKAEFGKKLKEMEEKLKQDMFNDFITLYAYNTNAIEGNTFTLRDTDLLLNKGITPQGKSLREANDQLNAKGVFEYILKEKPPVSHENIIKLHSMLLKNIDVRTGAYRSHNVRVFGARFETSSAEYVKIDMGILLKWYRKNKNKLHPLVLAAVFHHKFERIHPFYDGNGRTGRILLNLILLQNGIPPLIVPDAQRKKYYDALDTADSAGIDRLQPEHKAIIVFCHYCLLKAYNTVFKRWG